MFRNQRSEQLQRHRLGVLADLPGCSHASRAPARARARLDEIPGHLYERGTHPEQWLTLADSSREVVI